MLTVYTALTDDRDTLRDPEVVTEGVYYVCMSNTVKRTAVWDVIPIPPVTACPIRLARWCKIQAYRQFGSVNTIWMDATYTPKYDMIALVYRSLLTSSIAAFPHFERSCIYDEADEVLANNLDDRPVVEAQMAMIDGDGYPRSNGLFDTSVLVRRKCDDVDAMCDLWWSVVASGSRRDQLSFNYALWKTGVSCGTIRPGLTRKRGSVHDTYQPYFSAIFHRPKG